MHCWSRWSEPIPTEISVDWRNRAHLKLEPANLRTRQARSAWNISPAESPPVSLYDSVMACHSTENSKVAGPGPKQIVEEGIAKNWATAAGLDVATSLRIAAETVGIDSWANSTQIGCQPPSSHPQAKHCTFHFRSHCNFMGKWMRFITVMLTNICTDISLKIFFFSRTPNFLVVNIRTVDPLGFVLRNVTDNTGS